MGTSVSPWSQDKPALLENLKLAVKLEEKYKEEYRLTRDRLQTQPKVGAYTRSLFSTS